ncbi:MAG: MarR family transcriptional regulator [Rhodanobacteraceae bacterium]
MLRTVATPAARATDPETSHLAAEHHTRTGTRAYQQHQTIAAVRANEGRTSQELAELTGLDRYMLARRLPECVTAGAVKKGVAVECSVTKRKAHLWWPT